MSQTQVQEQGIALNGQKYDLSPSTVSSYAAEERVPFGRHVSLGTDKDLQGKLPSLSTDITGKGSRGVALHTHALENPQDGLEPGYDVSRPMSVMEKGKVFVEVEEAVTPLSSVYVRHAGKQQVQTVTFDADFVTANTINGKVGGLSIAEVTFAADHDTTMAALVAAILAANPYLSSVVSNTDGDNREITITTNLDAADQDASDFVVALGASQAGVVEAETVASVNSLNRGKYRTDADSASAAELPNAKFVRSSELSNGKLIAVLELL